MKTNQIESYKNGKNLQMTQKRFTCWLNQKKN